MAKTLEIKIFNCPILRKSSKDLKSSELQNKEIQQLILDMDQTMKNKDGWGLAAPQVGHNLRLVVINTQDGTMVLVNPKILRQSWKKEILEEGCLSLPEVFGLVKRSIKVTLTALDKNGKRIKFTANGMLARVIQHEVDHLEGILFVDKVRKITQGEKIFEKFKKGEI
ncbi:MAG: peptide deformylase [Candidatus Buchananbacteria bacterium]